MVRIREDRGSWEVDYRDVRGRRHRPMFATEVEAHTHAGKVGEELRAGLQDVVDDPDLTLGVYVDRWLLRATTEGQIASKTLASYRGLLTVHVTPMLGAHRLRDLKSRDVRALLHAKRTAQHGAGDHRRPYAKNSIRLIRAALSSCLTDAVEDGHLATNPAYGVGRKRKRAQIITEVDRLANVRPLRREDFAALLRATASTPYCALWALMGLAGLRPGEAAAVQVDDPDLAHRTLRVSRATTVGGRVDTIKATKTSCVRDVDLSRDLVVVLKRHVTRLRAEALKAVTGEPTYLFPVASGRLLDRYAVRDHFRRARKHAGLGHHRPYDLRHTFASSLLAAGAPITYVASQLGHHKPTMTLQAYAHHIPKQGRRWVDVLDGRSDARPSVEQSPKSSFVEPEGGTRAAEGTTNAG